MGPSWEGTGAANTRPSPSPHPSSLTGQAGWRPPPLRTNVPLRPHGTLSPFLLPGAKERAHQQKKHSSFEDELSEVLEKQNDQAELKGQCWPLRPETREGGKTAVVVGSRSQEAGAPPFRPARQRLGPHLPMRPREVKYLVHGIAGDASLGLSHSKALRRAHLPTTERTLGEEGAGLAGEQL